MRSMAGVTAMTIVICCTGLLPRAAATAQWTVTSPDGELAFELQLGDGTSAATAGALSYTVSHHKTPVVNRSTLGVRRDDQAFVDGLTFVEASPLASVDDTYTRLTASGESRGTARTSSASRSVTPRTAGST